MALRRCWSKWTAGGLRQQVNSSEARSTLVPVLRRRHRPERDHFSRMGNGEGQFEHVLLHEGVLCENVIERNGCDLNTLEVGDVKTFDRGSGESARYDARK
jgi:hypothetical protein